MNYQSLIASIQAAIYNNGAELITGNVLQAVLLDMVNALDSAGATFGGTITPASAAPADLDQPTVYLAPGAGTYEHFLDSNGDPIVVTSPSLIMYDGGQALIFTSMTLPFPQVLSVSGGNSLVIPIPDFKNSYRIDMTAQYTGGSEERYIGSLILEVNDLAMRVAHGYYYGDDMAEILSECAIWQDDPEIYPEEQGYYLLLTTQSDLDEVIFSVSSMDGKSVQMVESNEDEKIKVADATITPVGSGGGDGKMGVISQTQTWRGTGSQPRTYVMSDQVWGAIPQANIDLFESAGATFNESTGYFELNGLTDISYEEMQAVYNRTIGIVPNVSKAQVLSGQLGLRTNIPIKGTTSFAQSYQYFCYGSTYIEAVSFNVAYLSANNQTTGAFQNCNSLKAIIGDFRARATSLDANMFKNCYSLESLSINGLNASVSFAESSALNAASVAYMITNAGTATITITLHATAYARAIADADVQAALQSKTNVSLASA